MTGALASLFDDGGSSRSRRIPPLRLRRATKRDEIERFFVANLGTRLSTYELHARFGSAFRSRVSEINRSHHSPITIHNEVHPQKNGAEHSVYWSTRRTA